MDAEELVGVRGPVKVWIAPPIVKTTAPLNRVPLRPIASPMPLENTEKER